MSKKGKRLREFEMKNRDLSVTHSREEREGKKKKNSSAKSKPEVRKKKTSNIKKMMTCAITVMLIAFVGVSAVKLINLTRERDALLEKNQELKRLKEDISQEMENINSAEFMEQQARKELKLIKKNEILFIVSDDENVGSQKEQDSDGQAEN